MSENSRAGRKQDCQRDCSFWGQQTPTLWCHPQFFQHHPGGTKTGECALNQIQANKDGEPYKARVDEVSQND